MENILIFSTLIVIIFMTMRYLEYRYSENKEVKPIKQIIKEAMIVYLSIIIGHFSLEHFYPSILGDVTNLKPTQVFTDMPSF